MNTLWDSLFLLKIFKKSNAQQRTFEFNFYSNWQTSKLQTIAILKTLYEVIFPLIYALPFKRNVHWTRSDCWGHNKPLYWYLIYVHSGVVDSYMYPLWWGGYILWFTSLFICFRGICHRILSIRSWRFESMLLNHFFLTLLNISNGSVNSLCCFRQCR